MTATMTRKLPNLEALKGHVKAGLTNKQIAMLYGVTPEAVRLALAKEGIVNGPGRNDHSRFVPWRIRADHARHRLLHYLRSASRREQGIPQSDADERRLDEFLSYIDGANPYGVPLVVNYDRNDPEGFWLQPRQEGERLIHPPAEDQGR